MEKRSTKRKFLIATHGTFASGIKSSLDIITGTTGNVFLIEGYVDEHTSVEDEIKKIGDTISGDDELIVFSDILGGSITNQVLQHLLKPNVYVISGFNLPLVIEILLADEGTPIDAVINAAIENAKEQMVYVNKLLTAQPANNANDQINTN